MSISQISPQQCVAPRTANWVLKRVFVVVALATAILAILHGMDVMSSPTALYLTVGAEGLIALGIAVNYFHQKRRENDLRTFPWKNCALTNDLHCYESVLGAALKVTKKTARKEVDFDQIDALQIPKEEAIRISKDYLMQISPLRRVHFNNAVPQLGASALKTFQGEIEKRFKEQLTRDELQKIKSDLEQNNVGTFEAWMKRIDNIIQNNENRPAPEEWRRIYFDHVIHPRLEKMAGKREGELLSLAYGLSHFGVEAVISKWYRSQMSPATLLGDNDEELPLSFKTSNEMNIVSENGELILEIRAVISPVLGFNQPPLMNYHAPVVIRANLNSRVLETQLPPPKDVMPTFEEIPVLRAPKSQERDFYLGRM